MDREVVEILKGVQKSLDTLSKLQSSAKAISGTADAQLMFGPGGLFSNFGLDDTVINASMSPRGIDAMLPVVPTSELSPVFPFITGFESDGGAEPAGPCDDAPSGVMEVAHTTAPFGRYTRSSKEMEYNEIVGILNKRLTTDLRVLGSVFGGRHTLMPSEAQDTATFIQSVIQTQMVVVGKMLQNLLVSQVWNGSPLNNNVGGGYKEFPGLDTLIATGHVDAFTNTVAPALDSDVKDFNYNDVSGEDPDIVRYLAMMLYYLQHNANRMGLAPVQWVIAMRPELFFEITAVWPVRYLTDRGGVNMPTGTSIVINDRNNVELRDAMRQGSFLWINGVQVPVVTDDGIFEHNNANNQNLEPGEFASDIFVVPLRAAGIPVCYWEFLDYRTAQSDLSVLNNKQQFWPSDGGRYLWSVQSLNWCFKIQAKIEPRIILRTPQLAGKIQHVKYSPLQHLRSYDEDSPYFKKGGVEEYDTPPDFYTPWS